MEGLSAGQWAVADGYFPWLFARSSASPSPASPGHPLHFGFDRGEVVDGVDAQRLARLQGG